MATIHFKTIVDQEQVIRPPNGITIPQGEVEVSVRARGRTASPATDPLASTRDWLLALAAQAELAAPELPHDLAEHHDHYAHGKPLP